MTYKIVLLLFLPKKKKKPNKYKIIKNYVFFIFYGLLILDSSFFYTKLIHLVQKLKNLD